MRGWGALRGGGWGGSGSRKTQHFQVWNGRKLANTVLTSMFFELQNTRHASLAMFLELLNTRNASLAMFLELLNTRHTSVACRGAWQEEGDEFGVLAVPNPKPVKTTALSIKSTCVI